MARGLAAHMPRPVFQYTFDQIAQCLALNQTYMEAHHIHYQTVTAGPVPRDRMTAHNIAPLGEKPDWRVTESEFLRWLKLKGYKSYYGQLY